MALSGHIKRDENGLAGHMAARLDSGLRRNDGAVDLLPIFLVIVHVGCHRRHKT